MAAKDRLDGREEMTRNNPRARKNREIVVRERICFKEMSLMGRKWWKRNEQWCSGWESERMFVEVERGTKKVNTFVQGLTQLEGNKI